MYDRLIMLIGNDNLDKLFKTRVVIVGVGGVGGHCAESLLRSGVKNMLLIDFDKIGESNKNRQLIALDSTVGKIKVEVLKERLLAIDNEANIQTSNIFLAEENIDIITNYKADYVIDACDTVASKKSIIMLCQKENIKLVSSMGAGNRLDPSKLKITKLSKTSGDPLAKLIRKWLKDEKLKDIMVLSSDELPIKTGERLPGSTAFVPSSAGIMIASYVFKDIIKELN